MSDDIITSKDNPKLKNIRKLLTDKVYRWEQQEFIIEGHKIFEFAGDCIEIYLEEGQSLPENMAEQVAVFTVSSNVFKTISDTETPQGILSVCKMKVEQDLPAGNCVYLDQIQDPGNMGTIIRTAAAFSYSAVIIGKGSVDPFSPKVVRATMGAIFRVKIIFLDDLEHISNREIWIADQAGVSIALVKPKKEHILVIGSEAKGVSAKLKKIGQTVAIPISDNVESLNAAVAAGILMFTLQES